MELVLTQQEADPFPISIKQNIHNRPMGLLTSEYKAVSKSNYLKFNKQSLFGIRQAVKGQFYNSNSIAEVIVKLSFFIIVFLAVFA